MTYLLTRLLTCTQLRFVQLFNKAFIYYYFLLLHLWENYAIYSTTSRQQVNDKSPASWYANWPSHQL